MTLFIGDNITVPQEQIIAILPVREEGAKACILLADGRTVYSSIASTTLKKRLDGRLNEILRAEGE